MNKTKVILGTLVVGVLVVSGVALAATGDSAQKRYFIKSNSGILRAVFEANQNFDNGFTTNLTKGQLKVLEKLDIEIESVPLYYISAKPICGDGDVHPSEQCGESGLSDCPTGYICENCKCVEESTPPEEPERPCFPGDQYPWGVAKVNGGSGGTEVTVAVLDTGVYTGHLDLENNVVDCKDATRRKIKEGCTDLVGHGTHVAGTVLADGGDDEEGIYGVAPEAKLMAIKVCGPASCWTDDIAAGIRYAADNGANIISMSLGGPTQSSLIKDAVDYAVGKGVLVIASAGNSGPAEGSIGYPAANLNVVAVAAFNSSNNIASFSSRGVNDGNWIIEEREIEFAAPGVDVESIWNDGCYNIISGTSMATPHIAGIAARDWKGTASATRVYLQNLARTYTEDTTNGYDYGDLGDDIEAGLGLPI